MAEESSASTEQVSAATEESAAAAEQVTATAGRVTQTAVALADLAVPVRPEGERDQERPVPLEEPTARWATQRSRGARSMSKLLSMGLQRAS